MEARSGQSSANKINQDANIFLPIGELQLAIQRAGMIVVSFRGQNKINKYFI